MTPLMIDICFHYVTRGGDYRNGDFSAPAVREAIDLMKSPEVGLLKVPELSCGVSYVATDRLRVYIDRLCSIPLPVQAWIYPDEAKERGVSL